jgi:glycosyltransferase involved in cell wall biosynthesis
VSADPPKVSVVFATHERAERLAELLRSLEAQTLPPDDFEVIAVDDGSRDATGEVLDAAERSSPLRLRTVRREPAAGPAVARNAGWRLAQGPLVAFTDDDCVANPGWLEAGLRGAAEYPGSVLQGRTEPRADELHLKGVFSRTLEVPRLSQHFQTCNVFYPRELLERVGGFDETFSVPGGEDADLAWRVIEGGAGTAFLGDARVAHAVARIGPVGKLRVAWRWTETTKIYARHPELRRRILTHGVFWKRTHYLLARLILALLLPRRLRPLGWWLAYPYLAHLRGRGRVEGGGLLMGPYYLVHDLVELAAMVRGSLRYRTVVI